MDIKSIFEQEKEDHYKPVGVVTFGEETILNIELMEIELKH